MEDEKKLQESLTEDISQPEPEIKPEGEPKVKSKPSDIPYYRFKEENVEKKQWKEKAEKLEAEMKKWDGTNLNEVQEYQKLKQDLTDPELLTYIKQKTTEYYANKRTPTETTMKPNAKIVDLEKRMEQFEIDKLSARIEDNLGKLERDFGKFDKEKLLTLVEEDGYNPTSYKHVKACFKEYFSDDISAKKKSDLEQKIKNLPEGGGSGGKPADATPDDIGEIFRLKKAGKI